jgi:hypothetical protein
VDVVAEVAAELTEVATEVTGEDVMEV